MTKKLYVAAMGLGIIAIILGATACALQLSLPYRIGYQEYQRYLWAPRCAGASIVLAVGTVLLGCGARHALSSVTLALVAVVLSINLGIVSFHSGPMPQMWCHNALQNIGWVKERIAKDRSLSAGAVVPEKDITALLRDRGNWAWKCADGGKYTYNPIGVEPRCSIHGSVSEMESAWKVHQMKAQPSVSGDGKPSPQR